MRGAIGNLLHILRERRRRRKLLRKKKEEEAFKKKRIKRPITIKKMTLIPQPCSLDILLKEVSPIKSTIIVRKRKKKAGPPTKDIQKQEATVTKELALDASLVNQYLMIEAYQKNLQSDQKAIEDLSRKIDVHPKKERFIIERDRIEHLEEELHELEKQFSRLSHQIFSDEDIASLAPFLDEKEKVQKALETYQNKTKEDIRFHQLLGQFELLDQASYRLSNVELEIDNVQEQIEEKEIQGDKKPLVKKEDTEKRVIKVSSTASILNQSSSNMDSIKKELLRQDILIEEMKQEIDRASKEEKDLVTMKSVIKVHSFGKTILYGTLGGLLLSSNSPISKMGGLYLFYRALAGSRRLIDQTIEKKPDFDLAVLEKLQTEKNFFSSYQILLSQTRGELVSFRAAWMKKFEKYAGTEEYEIELQQLKEVERKIEIQEQQMREIFTSYEEVEEQVDEVERHR